MYLRAIQLQNFRNIQSLDLELNQGFVVLNGANGAGKSNFLESIYFGGSLRRFPESQFGQLFQDGQNFFKIRLLSGEPEPKQQEVAVEQREGKYIYQFKLNNQSLPRRRYVGSLPVVSFVPQDLNLLARSPANRRRFLNEILTQTSAEYHYAHRQYEKVLRQRNGLWQKIQNQAAQPAELGIWDEQLAEFGSVVCRFRQSLFRYLNAGLSPILAEISPELPAAEFVYQMSGNTDKSDFLHRLQTYRPREQERFTSLFGPHRDDFTASLGSHPAVGFASRGQMRSLTLALKILEKQYFSAQQGSAPLLLLDDVFSEFDSRHQEHVLGFLKSFEQVFLTTAHLDMIRSLSGDAAVFDVEAGQISPAR